MSIYEDFLDFEEVYNHIIVPFDTLRGKTLKSVVRDDDFAIYFHTTDNEVYKMCHIQSCSESVYIEDLDGELQSLVGSPILQANETTSQKQDSSIKHSTWTFYNLYTLHGDVNIRWYGTSNGYYSERVALILGQPKKGD